MNLSDLPIRLISPNSHTATVSVWDVPMVCEYEYDEGEPPVLWPTDLAHPGSPPNASLLTCEVGGVNIYEMLTPEQVERIEEAILETIQ